MARVAGGDRPASTNWHGPRAAPRTEGAPRRWWTALVTAARFALDLRLCRSGTARYAGVSTGSCPRCRHRHLNLILLVAPSGTPPAVHRRFRVLPHRVVQHRQAPLRGFVRSHRPLPPALSATTPTPSVGVIADPDQPAGIDVGLPPGRATTTGRGRMPKSTANKQGTADASQDSREDSLRPATPGARSAGESALKCRSRCATPPGRMSRHQQPGPGESGSGPGGKAVASGDASASAVTALQAASSAFSSSGRESTN